MIVCDFDMKNAYNSIRRKLDRVVVETNDMCARVLLDHVRRPSLRRNFEVPSAGA